MYKVKIFASKETETIFIKSLEELTEIYLQYYWHTSDKIKLAYLEADVESGNIGFFKERFEETLIEIKYNKINKVVNDILE